MLTPADRTPHPGPAPPVGFQGPGGVPWGEDSCTEKDTRGGKHEAPETRRKGRVTDKGYDQGPSEVVWSKGRGDETTKSDHANPEAGPN